MSGYLQYFCSAKNALDPVLVEIGDATVHELQEDLEVLVAGAIQDHDQLSVEGGVAEELGEVCAAGG